MKLIAIIPARGGSKGVKDKNIRPLAGKPLLHHTLEAAIDADVFDQIILTSDSENILSSAKKFPAVLHKRPLELAQDDTPTDPVIYDLIKTYDFTNKDLLVLLQPTSPLRSAKHIRDAIQKYTADVSARGLISTCEVDNKYLKAYLDKGHYLQPLVAVDAAYTRRQDLPSLYMPNGAIYIFSVEEFMREKNIPRTQLISYLMSAEDSVDIDSEDDFVKVEKILQQRSCYGEQCH